MLGEIRNITPPVSPNASPQERATLLAKYNYAQEYRSWQASTWENSIRFPGGFEDPEIQRVRSTVSPMWFDQEYGAKFTAMSGAIYDEWDANIHVIDSYEFRADPSTHPNYLAFDYGFSNPTVALDIQVSPDGVATVWREYYMSGLSTPVHAHNIVSRPQPPDYHVDGMWGDPRGADEEAIYSSYLGYGAVYSEDVRWKLTVEQIKRMLAARPPKLVVHKSCTNLIRQMTNLHVKEQGRQAKFDLQEMMGDGNIQHKVDDHAPDALRYFIGPYFVNGGNMHLSDIYGNSYAKSESHDFFTLHSNVTLSENDLITLS